MGKVLSTFNSKDLNNRIIGLLIFLTLLLTLDRLVFRLFYYNYDFWYGNTSVTMPNEIFIVGSSHIAWAVNPIELQRQTHLKTGIFSVPGASIVPRYYALQERLENKKLPPPKLIIFEVSKWALIEKGRYVDDVSEDLAPYCLNGIMVDYCARFPGNSHIRTFSKFFHSLSINHHFTYSTNPMNWLRMGIRFFAGDEIYTQYEANRLQKKLFNNPTNNESNVRIAKWRATAETQYGDLWGSKSALSTHLMSYLEKSIALAKKSNVKVILLETPSYQFSHTVNGLPVPGYERFRKVYQGFESKNVHYLSLSFPNDSNLFSDEGHLDSNLGKPLFTSKLIEYLKSIPEFVRN